MKTLSRFLFNTSALLALCSFQTSVFAEAPDIRPGRYAPVSSENARMHHNRSSFSCAGNGAYYCHNLEKSNAKFTPEEKELVNGSEISGDIVIRKDDATGEYSISAKIYVLRTCEVSTDSMVNDDYKAYLYRDKFVDCISDDNGFIHCPLKDPGESDNGENPVLFTISQESPDRLKITARLSESAAESMSPYCMPSIEKDTFVYESEDEFRHNMYLSAKLDFMRTDADINHYWKNMPKEQRKKALPDQRNWIKEKDKKCGAVTMRGSEEELTKMYRCQAAMTEKRQMAMGN